MNSPTPWHVEHGVNIHDSSNKLIGWFDAPETEPDDDEANAKLAVEAVNKLEKLRNAALYTLNLLLMRSDGKTHCVLTWDELSGAALKLRDALGMEEHDKNGD